jgi:hypothetical protein
MKLATHFQPSRRHIMNIAASAPIALGVMAFAVACASAQGRTSETPPPAPTVSTPTAPGEGGGSTSALERYVGTYQTMKNQ